MQRPAKLSDLQLILLSTAAARDDVSLLPLADSISATAPARVAKAIQALLKSGLVEQTDAPDAAAIWREEDGRRVGLTITSAGRAAIGAEAGGDLATPPAPQLAPAPKRPTKSAAVLALLQREEGATLAELVAATGWLPHTTRAALTGLRKKGHDIAKAKRGDVTCYHVAAAA